MCINSINICIIFVSPLRIRTGTAIIHRSIKLPKSLSKQILFSSFRDNHQCKVLKKNRFIRLIDRLNDQNRNLKKTRPILLKEQTSSRSKYKIDGKFCLFVDTCHVRKHLHDQAHGCCRKLTNTHTYTHTVVTYWMIGSNIRTICMD